MATERLANLTAQKTSAFPIEPCALCSSSIISLERDQRPEYSKLTSKYTKMRSKNRVRTEGTITCFCSGCRVVEFRLTSSLKQ